MIIVIIIILVLCVSAISSSSILSLAGGGGGLFFLSGDEDEGVSVDDSSTDTGLPPTSSSALDSFSLLNSQYGQAGRNDKTFKDKTAESCAKACLDETSFNCKSFDFTDNGTCYLSKSIVSDGGSYNKNYPGYKYYEKKDTN